MSVIVLKLAFTCMLCGLIIAIPALIMGKQTIADIGLSTSCCGIALAAVAGLIWMWTL